MCDINDEIDVGFNQYYDKEFNCCWECGASVKKQDRHDAVIGPEGGKEFYTACHSCLDAQEETENSEPDYFWCEDCEGWVYEDQCQH